MKSNNYNYSLAVYFKPKIYIPIIGIEVRGWGGLIIFVVGCVTAISVLGTGLYLLLGNNGYYVATLIVLAATIILITFFKQHDKNAGVNKVEEFYYMKVKKNRFIYDSHGNRRYIDSIKKGKVYVNSVR